MSIKYLTIALFSLLFFIISGQETAFCQNQKDSLLGLIKKADSNTLPALQNKLAGIYYLEGNITQASELANKTLQQAKRTENFPVEAGSLKILGLCENFKGNFSKAIEFYKMAEEIYNTLNDKNSYADCLNNRGICYLDHSQMNLAIDCFQQALKIKEDLNIDDPELLTNAGLAYEETGLYDKAFEMYLKALKIDEKLNNSIGMGYDYCNIANIFDRQNNLNKAIEYFQKSYDIFIHSGRKEQIAIISANIGTSWQKQKKYDKALGYFLSSLAIRKEINNQRMIANICNSIGDLYMEKNDYPKAIQFFHEALMLADSIGSGKAIAHSQLNIGKIYKKMKDYPKSYSYLEKSSIIAASQKIYDLLPEIYLNMSDVWAFQNDFKKSLDFYKRYTAVKDTINNEISKKSLIEMEARFETTKKEQQIILLKKDNELIYEKSVRKNIIIFVSLGIIAILLILAFVIYRLYLEKKMANEILEEQFKSINEKLTIIHSIPASATNSSTRIQASNVLKITNSNGIIELEINCEDLFYIASLGNYLEIIWKNKEKVQKSIIRNTMKNLDWIVEKNSNLIRCHRSYIVNLKHVEQVTGKSQNYKIKFDHELDEIPISRNFSKDIISKINTSLNY